LRLVHIISRHSKSEIRKRETEAIRQGRVQSSKSSYAASGETQLTRERERDRDTARVLPISKGPNSNVEELRPAICTFPFHSRTSN